MQKISIISPCYNEEESVPLFYEEIKKTMGQIEGYTYELIFVNDGSKDNTLSVIRDISSKDDDIKYVSFSRNFGKESAMYAGLEHCVGDYAVIMDCDLQHPPALLPVMIKEIESGEYDCIATKRADRAGEAAFKRLFSGLFYKLTNMLSDTEVVDGACDFRLMSRPMVDAILSLDEKNRFSKGIFSWVGFETKWIEFNNADRVAGTSKWSFKNLFKYAIDGIVAFSTKPLKIAAWMGLIVSFISFIFMIQIIFEVIFRGIATPGFATTMVVLLMIGGLILIALGIIGEYVGKMYLETKQRPIYIAKEVKTDKKEEGK